MSFFDRLREERERLGLSQAAMAAIAGTSLRSQSGWEKGRSSPSTEAYQAWAKIGLDVGYVITGIQSGQINSPMLTTDEQFLLDSYRASSVPVRNAALAVLLSGGQAPEGVDTSKERKGRAAPRKHIQQTNVGNAGVNIGGDFVSGKKERK